VSKSSKRLYYKFSDYLKERFGCRVTKISVDAGFSCPNRDGKAGADGCIYCDNRAFSRNSRLSLKPVEEQIDEAIAGGRGGKKYILYFQANTNTYAPPDALKEKYDIIRKYENFAGLAVGTRPDCVSEEILDLLNSYSDKYEVFLEYGVQSMHDKTLSFINRGHSFSDFLRAVKMTRRYEKIKISAHVIIGLPFETKKEIFETADALGALKLDGIKIHPIHVVKGTKLAGLYDRGKFKPLEMDEFIEAASGFLERLWPDTVIERLTADCPEEYLVAPLWINEKNKVLKGIEAELIKGGTYQGKLWGKNDGKK
jgi:uncharacterized protein